MAGEPFESPGQPGGGGLVPGEEQRDDLVPQLIGGHGRTVLLPVADQHGQHVGPGVEFGVEAGPLELLEQEGVGAGLALPEAAPGPVVAQPGHDELGHLPHRDVAQVEQRGPQAVEPGLVGDADDGLEDDLEGDGPHPVEHREGSTDRPPVHVGGGDGRHAGHQPGDRAAVERAVEPAPLTDTLPLLP